MPKYLLLKHYRGGPEPHHPVPPIDQWAPELPAQLAANTPTASASIHRDRSVHAWPDWPEGVPPAIPNRHEAERGARSSAGSHPHTSP